VKERNIIKSTNKEGWNKEIHLIGEETYPKVNSISYKVLKDEFLMVRAYDTER
jgi:hypothetical protein